MKPVVKNKQIQAMLDYEKKHLNMDNLPESKKSNIISSSSREESIMHIFYGYYSSLVDLVADSEYHIELDLTYDTVGNLLTAVGYEFMIGMNSGYSIKEDIEIAEKTIASYLTLLAMNEHGAVLSIVPSIEGFKDVSKTMDIQWGGLFQVFIKGALVQKDLLKAIHGCVSFTDSPAKIHIDPQKIATDYKALTGVDLYQYDGFDECEFTVDNPTNDKPVSYEYTFLSLSKIRKDIIKKVKSGTASYKEKKLGEAASYSMDFIDIAKTGNCKLNLYNDTESEIPKALVLNHFYHVKKGLNAEESRTELKKKLAAYEMFSIMNGLIASGVEGAKIELQLGNLVIQAKASDGKVLRFDVYEKIKSALASFSITANGEKSILFGTLAPFYQELSNDFLKKL